MATDRLRHGGVTQIIEKTQSKIRQYGNRLLFIEHNKLPEQANLIGQIISLFMKTEKKCGRKSSMFPQDQLSQRTL